MKGVSLFNFNIHGDHCGNLVALEQGIDIPFDVKRIYYIWGTDCRAVRGKHAHRRLEQIIICLSGSCKFILDNGKEKKEILLNKPAQGLHIKHNIWREFTDFSDDCVVMVLASEHYDEADYIRDYNMFISETKYDTSII